ncbi:transposase [Pseudoruminococcus massiliensis]|uniref:transposase n=1 Tax=Pseudoruminococcus massiliensis TaxID=2086583 RepID=UPI003AB70AE8
MWEHKDLGINACAKNLGISKSVLSIWCKLYESNEDNISTRGRGNYESDAAKGNDRLKKELRDAQDALEILKKAIGNRPPKNSSAVIRIHIP